MSSDNIVIIAITLGLLCVALPVILEILGVIIIFSYVFILCFLKLLERTFDFFFNHAKWKSDNLKIKEESKTLKEKRKMERQQSYQQRISIKCPNCGSNHVSPISYFSEQYKYKSYICSNCRYRW